MRTSVTWARVSSRSRTRLQCNRRLRVLALDALPELAHHPHQQLRFLPAVRQFVAVRSGHRVFAWAQLAEERQHRVRRRAPAPAAKAVLPPAHEEIEPVALMREAELHLDLLAARDPAMEAPALVDHPAHQAVVLVGNRPSELAPDD